MGGRNGDKAPGGKGGGGRRAGPDDLVTVYHRTSERNAQAIERQGFKPRYNRDVNPGYRKENSQYAFVTRRPNAQRGYGDALIKIRVRRADLLRDPYSGHYRIPVAKIKRQNISRGT